MITTTPLFLGPLAAALTAFLELMNTTGGAHVSLVSTLRRLDRYLVKLRGQRCHRSGKSHCGRRSRAFRFHGTGGRAKCIAHWGMYLRVHQLADGVCDVFACKRSAIGKVDARAEFEINAPAIFRNLPFGRKFAFQLLRVTIEPD